MLKQVLRQFLPTRSRDPTTLLDSALALVNEGRFKEAEVVFRELSILKPDDPEARHLLGYVQYRRSQFPGAVAALEQAIELAPDRADIYYTLGRTRIAYRAYNDGAGALKRAVELAPTWAPAWISLGDALAGSDNVDEAEHAYLKAIDLAPRLAETHYNYGNLLIRLGRIADAIQSYQKALEHKPDFEGAHNNLVYALNFSDAYTPEYVFKAHLEWAGRYAEPLTRQAAPHPRPTKTVRQLRIGYVSANFRDHAVTYFFEPVLKRHDLGRFSTYCYSDTRSPDARTDRLRAMAAIWRETSQMSDEELARLIRIDRIDILVDLTGHTESDRLKMFARKAAPVQVTWNGYANTTGMTAIDYRITDPYADPPGMTDDLHTEKLLRMPEIYMPFEKPEDDVPEGPCPCLQRGYVTFGSFNAISKITPRMIELWSRILCGVPSSRLLMLTVPEGNTRSRLRSAFSECGVDADRVEMRGRLKQRNFMAAHQDADIALDCYPFNGTTTTAHTLWMGLPVITLAGRSHVARVGVSMLENVGLSELVASSENEYVECAVKLASNAAWLQGLRQSLRARMLTSPNMDGVRFTRFLEQAYLSIWNDYRTAALSK
ncbi:MAG: tetratricopeptide repeat protein [Burkholderiales bacterium]